MKAFPSKNHNSSKPHDYYDGMDLRDYFAAKAMQSMLQWQVIPSDFDMFKEAYRYADDMMKARQL